METTMGREESSGVEIYALNGAYLYTQYIARENGNYSVIRRKEVDGNQNVEQVTIPIKPSFYRPVLEREFTLAEVDTAQFGYIKNTSPLSVQRNIDPRKAVRRELWACENMRLRPHHNLAKYRGCLVTDGLVSALVFERHVMSLMEQLNPEGMSKAAFVQRRTLDLSADMVRGWMDRVANGLRHMHALGIVHNDLSPSKIMFTTFSGIVIVGFESCLPIGASTVGVKRTHGWHDPAETIAHPRNDFAALEEIRIWLERDLETDFQFREETLGDLGAVVEA